MNNRIIFLVASLFLIFSIACDKNSTEEEIGGNKTVPTLTTSDVSEITSTSAKSGGTITSNGGSPISQRGVCFGTSINPSLADSHTSDGNGTGTYESSITGLLPNTDYYVRAYATNDQGTGYGSSVQFTTLPALLEGTYNEQNHNYRHIKIVNSGNMIQLYVVSSDPNSYCDYENRGKLTSNPSTGFVVAGDWYKFNPIDTWCTGSAFWVVQQKDNNTIIVRSHVDNYESAHDLGAIVTYVK